MRRKCVRRVKKHWNIIAYFDDASKMHMTRHRTHIRVGVKYSWPSTQVHQVPKIYTKYKYWSSTHFLKKSQEKSR